MATSFKRLLATGVAIGTIAAGWIIAPAAAETMGVVDTAPLLQESSSAGQLLAADCIRTADGTPFRDGSALGACDSITEAVGATPSPVAGGKPTAANTGPAASAVLRDIYGDLVLSRPGEVLDSVRVHGTVRVAAAGVTIRNSLIAGRAGLSSGQPLIYAGLGTSSGLLIENTEVAPSDRRWIVNGIFGFDFRAVRVDVHHVLDSVHIFGSNVSVERSWLHDNYHGPDKNQSDGVTHDDSVQIQQGRNIELIGNSMSGAYNAALQVTQDQGSVSDLRFAGNWVSGGGCSLNIAEKTRGVITELAITDNRMGQSRFNCPIILSPAAKEISTLSGNVWEDTSKPVHLTCRAAGTPNWRC